MLARLKLCKAFCSPNDLGLHALAYLFFINRLLVSFVLTVPEMKHLCGHKTIFSLNSQMTEPQNKVCVFMAPTLKDLVEAVDTDEVTPPYTQVATPDTPPHETLLYPE